MAHAEALAGVAAGRIAWQEAHGAAGEAEARLSPRLDQQAATTEWVEGIDVYVHESGAIRQADRNAGRWRQSGMLSGM